MRVLRRSAAARRLCLHDLRLAAARSGAHLPRSAVRSPGAGNVGLPSCDRLVRDHPLRGRSGSGRRCSRRWPERPATGTRGHRVATTPARGCAGRPWPVPLARAAARDSSHPRRRFHLLIHGRPGDPERGRSRGRPRSSTRQPGRDHRVPLRRHDVPDGHDAPGRHDAYPTGEQPVPDRARRPCALTGSRRAGPGSRGLGRPAGAGGARSADGTPSAGGARSAGHAGPVGHAGPASGADPRRLSAGPRPGCPRTGRARTHLRPAYRRELPLGGLRPTLARGATDLAAAAARRRTAGTAPVHVTGAGSGARDPPAARR